MKTPSCIACQRPLRNLDERGNQPGDGLEFTTPGHYGTTKFDPMDGTRLAINVCDDCLDTARIRGDVLFVTSNRYSPWKQEG